MEASRIVTPINREDTGVHANTAKEGLIDHKSPWVRAAAFVLGVAVITAEAGAEIIRTIKEGSEGTA